MTGVPYPEKYDMYNICASENIREHFMLFGLLKKPAIFWIKNFIKVWYLLTRDIQVFSFPLILNFTKIF